MKLILLTLSLAIFRQVTADCVINGQDVPAGQYLDVFPFRQSCFSIPGGWEYYPTACVTVESVVLKSGENITNVNKTAVFECQQSGAKNMSFNPIACVTPKGNVILAGQIYNELGSGQYTCQRVDAKTITLNLNAKGCVMDGKFLTLNSYNVDAGNTTQYQCNLVSNKYVMVAKNCYKDGGKVSTSPDNWGFISGLPYSCISVADSTGATTATLNLITNTNCANTAAGSNKKLGDTWNVSNSNYQCTYDMKNKISVIQLKTCYDENGAALNSGSTTQLKNGSFAYCDGTKGYYVVDPKWNTCKLPDNQTIAINKLGNCTTDSNIYQCRYDGTKSWTPAINCWVGATTINLGGNVYGVPSTAPTSAYKCTSVRASLNALYKLNQTEFDAWMKSQGGSSGISGANGGGSGATVATTTTTTTTVAPTTPTTTQSTTPTPTSTLKVVPPSPTVCADSCKELCQKVGPICIARASFVDHTDDEWCASRDVYNAQCRSYMRASVDVLAALCPVTCNVCSKVPDVTDAVSYMVTAIQTASQKH